MPSSRGKALTDGNFSNLPSLYTAPGRYARETLNKSSAAEQRILQIDSELPKKLSAHSQSDSIIFSGVIVCFHHKFGKGCGVRMMVETYLRRGKRTLQRLSLDPTMRSVGAVLAYGGSGFLLSGAGLGNYPQPLAMGLICATTGWRTLVMSLGAMVGYPTFWGSQGNLGIVWSAAGGLLALLVGKKEESRDQPLMLSAITAFLAAVAELSFRLILGAETPIGVSCLRVALAFFSGVLFTQAFACRDPMTDWLVGAVGVLALARVSLGPHFGLGYLAAGVMAMGCAFPAAVLAGLALDLAQVTKVPMTAVMCMAWLLRQVPFDKRWQHYAAPAAAWGAVCWACTLWDPAPLPGLAVGGALGALLPPRPQITHRRGQTGVAQVRLEVGAEVLGRMQQLALELEASPIDQQALLETVRQRACEGCSARKTCQQRLHLTPQMLENPLEADCRKQGRLIPELRRAREQWKLLQADRRRQEEYRTALAQQYRFLSSYLRTLADRLPRSSPPAQAAFRIEAAARTRGKEQANGDRCLAFSGSDCRYYVLLCDGMGTGVGAAMEGKNGAELLRRMLLAGFPAEHALSSLNSLLALGSRAGAVTVDLAEIHLDKGHVYLYKWGAAPSWLLSRGRAEKIGTATPPPGISVQETRPAQKLSLRRGEVLVLLSDGVDGEEIRRRSDLSVDLSPGELGTRILAGVSSGEDDATAAVIKLRPTSLAPS